MSVYQAISRYMYIETADATKRVTATVTYRWIGRDEPVMDI